MRNWACVSIADQVVATNLRTFLSMAQQTPVGQDILIVEPLRSHSNTSHSVGLLWKSDQPEAETTHNTHKRKTSMPPAGFEPAIPARAAADPRLRPRGYWDRHNLYISYQNSTTKTKMVCKDFRKDE